MKKINLIIVIILLSTLSFSQKKETKWTATTNILIGYYHFGSYSKENPIIGLEELIEFSPFEKFRFGIGFGVNIYPAVLAFPVYVSAKYITPISEKWNFYALQSYGRNIRIGELGFNSNRYFGDFGFSFKLNQKLHLNPSIGYLFNWDSWGGKTLSLTGGIGLGFDF